MYHNGFCPESGSVKHLLVIFVETNGNVEFEIYL